MDVHTGVDGCAFNGGVLRQTRLYEKLTSGGLNLPPSSVLPDTNTLAPHVLFRRVTWRHLQENPLLGLNQNNQREHTEEGKAVRNTFTEFCRYIHPPRPFLCRYFASPEINNVL
ncbi:hypothetical protein ILUMI_14461 [Ignelater luminosus]|uniref:Uncharacterized protein n=1 Tax=Ignelater luminosus TaxID=2038154 RepID=A0A8K0CWI8_IGNLU|nr:hypothetical protein ILUMI_14461 [Ignelater luminosus]